MAGDTTQTRDRLIAAAGEIFAEQGFQSATVRDICAAAGANLAAVNYHFGDKLGLYSAVHQDAHRGAMERHPPSAGLAPGASTRERLHAFVRSFLYRLLDRGRPAWHGKLMAREINEPTAALDLLVEQAIRPNFQLLCSIVVDHVGPGLEEHEVRTCAWSVVGQILFSHFARPVIERLAPDAVFEAREIEQLADHITRFSLEGLTAMNRAQRTTRTAASSSRGRTR